MVKKDIQFSRSGMIQLRQLLISRFSKLITQLIDVSYSYEVEMLLILTAIFVQFFRLTTYMI